MKRIVIAAALAASLISQAEASWVSGQATDPTDDSAIHWIRAPATGVYTNRYGKTGTAEIIIQCEKNTTLVVLRLPELYTSDNGHMGRATFRIDSKPALTKDMMASNDHESLALRGRDAIHVIKEMLSGNRMLARVIAVSEPHKDIYFSISGINQKLSDIRASCAW